MAFVIVFALLAASLIVALALPASASLYGFAPGQIVEAAIYASIAIVLLGSLTTRYQGRLGEALRSATIWAVLTFAFLTLYSYRDTVESVAVRVWGELVPGEVSASSPGEAVVTRRRDGQFVLGGLVNGVRVTFIFDTGASSVVLRAEDAARIGISTADLSFDVPVSTANGRALAAEVNLASLSVGGVTQTRVRALVASPGALRESLLGQTFLERLKSYTVENNRLVLRGGGKASRMD